MSSNELAIVYTTTIHIPDYARYYSDIPIQLFQPTYLALPDGSLVAQPLIDDIGKSMADALISGVFAMLFLRNIFVSGDYLYRAVIASKMLLWALFVSQAVAFISLLPVIASFWRPWIDCRIVFTLSSIGAYVSIAILMLWIHGYKAYRCLDNSRVVLLALVVFLCGTVAVVILEMVHLDAQRRLSGSCRRTDDMVYSKAYIFLNLAQALCICGCFILSVWRSRNAPDLRGRMSLQLTLSDALSSHKAASSIGGNWRTTPPAQQSPTTSDSFVSSALTKMASWIGKPDTPRYARKPSYTGDAPLPQPPRVNSAHSSMQNLNVRPAIPMGLVHSGHARNQSMPSRLSRISRFFPRVSALRAVLKDELLYTTFVAVSCAIVAIFAAVGVSSENSLAVANWISLYWSILSILAIHSFGRVVRRHERDAVLLEPGTWRTGSIPMTGRGGFNSFRQRDPFRDTQITESETQSVSWVSHSNASYQWTPVVVPEDDVTLSVRSPRGATDVSSVRSSSVGPASTTRLNTAT